jgi:hypothetical protein
MLSDEDALELLRTAMPAPRNGVAADLWPEVHRRIEAGHAAPPASDWLIVIALAVLCALQPSLIGILLLHF